MKGIGKIIRFNGFVGKIVENNDLFYFSKRDINQEKIEVGDTVEYRKEFREPDLKLARYIKVLVKKDDRKNN